MLAENKNSEDFSLELILTLSKDYQTADCSYVILLFSELQYSFHKQLSFFGVFHVGRPLLI